MKALVSVVFRTAEEGGRGNDAVGGKYQPKIVMENGNGEMLGMNFNEPIQFIRGKRFITEIESIYEDLQNYEEVKEGKKFVVCEDDKIVAEGRILATSPPTKK